MSIQKKEYELSVWSETLGENGQKIEHKEYIIGAHDMDYLGRATNIKLTKKLNGTHSLTFQLPDKWYDSEKGEYVRNEFIEQLFNEKKVKLYYMDEWYEFYIKNVQDTKQFKFYMKSYTCSDAFIDELSRNGYGITFDEELYNNVEEIGTFTEEILEDSVWYYSPQNNWGDFTEYLEEKMYKIPISIFGSKLQAYKLDYQIQDLPDDSYITNIFTGEKRNIELGDDLSRNTYYWDQRSEDGADKKQPLISELTDVENDGYIYVFYSCLDFCYQTADDGNGFTSTEEAQFYKINGEVKSYALAPNMVDPNGLIQFMAIPSGAEIEVDEAGLITNKDYHYVMTVKQWNDMLEENSQCFYKFESLDNVRRKDFYIKGEQEHDGYPDTKELRQITGNWAVYYEGYLDQMGSEEVLYGKKISISDRTEINITEDIDQYVTVYNNFPDEQVTIEQVVEEKGEGDIPTGNWYVEEVTTNKYNFINPDELWIDSDEKIDYRICSVEKTRQIVPQLARNLIENAINIESTDGWAVAKKSDNIYISSAKIEFTKDEIVVNESTEGESAQDKSIEDELKGQTGILKLTPPFPTSKNVDGWEDLDPDCGLILNFGIVGQEYEIEPKKIYCIGIDGEFNIKDEIIIGEGGLVSDGNYKFIDSDRQMTITWKEFSGIKDEDYNKEIEKIKADEDSYKDEALNSIEGCNAYIDYLTFQLEILEKELIEINSSFKKYNTKYNMDQYVDYTSDGLITIKYSELGEARIPAEVKDQFEEMISLKVKIQAIKNQLNQANKTKSELLDAQYNQNFLSTVTYRLIQFDKAIKNPYFGIRMEKTDREKDDAKLETRTINSIYFFEAYTKGVDQFGNGEYKYSGRELFDNILNDPFLNNDFVKWSLPIFNIRDKIIFENDIMAGDTYGYQQYFIQQIQAEEWELNEDGVLDHKDTLIDDTFAQKEFLSNDNIKDYGNVSKRQLPYSAKDFSEDNLTISTKYVDLNNCPYYLKNAKREECDCCHNKENKMCMYQKYGYCPYLFETEKHCRKIRTLKGEKSNRFNLTQELGKVFEVYPVYWINHEENGKAKHIEKDGATSMDKRIFFITEKGLENKLGFRYELNLSNISRTIKSDQIVTKLYVQDVDSSISKTGLCSIKTAQDNPSKDSFIIDFSYYITKGILDKQAVENDLYGTNEGDMGYLKKLGELNSSYDKLSDLIINLSAQSFTELEANLSVNLDAIVTAQQQLVKLKAQAEKYKAQIQNKTQNQTSDETQDQTQDETQNQTYKNYQTKINEQLGILNTLIEETFVTNGEYTKEAFKAQGAEFPPDKGEDGYANLLDQITIEYFKGTDWYKDHKYQQGILGQYNEQYKQIQAWKRQQQAFLQQINELSLAFFRKYEPYLKEGTWSDSNYLTDNAYYFGAREVAAEGAIPKVEYTITVIDLYALPEYEDYKFDIADTTYIEDIGMFGINKKTGLPNRLKVLISEITYDLDQPKNNSIKVQNFTTQFEDLFSQVSASVQSLSFNENIYKRSKNFTSNQNVKNESLQGALDTNELTLLNTQENNISIDKTGQSGSSINNHSNQYKLDGQGLYFSNNGGQTWNVGVGPSGINADYIKVGSLDVGKVQLIDNDYLYFMWDKDGIVALRDPLSSTAASDGAISLSDYSVFNKYGLSIIENGKVRLRAGYDYATAYKDDDDNYYNSGQGKYNANDPLSPNVGFYLYNDNGQPIFSTIARENTARLALTGEILAQGLNGDYNSGLLYSNGISLKIDDARAIDTTNSNLEDWSDIVDPSQSDTAYIIYIDGEKTKITTNKQQIYNYNGKAIINWNNKAQPVNGRQSVYLYENDAEDFSSDNDISRSTNKITYYKNGEEMNLPTYFYINNSYYQNKTVNPTESTKVNTGVYVNNQTLTKESNKLNNGAEKRIFSCLTLDRNILKNLFTVTANGYLQIGGTAEAYDLDEKGNIVSKQTSLDDLGNYLLFGGYDNAIRIEGNKLFLGNEDIAGSIAKAAGALPNHHHTYTAYTCRLVEDGKYPITGWTTGTELGSFECVTDITGTAVTKTTYRLYEVYTTQDTSDTGWQ